MSSTILKIISDASTFKPSTNKLISAEAFLASIYKNEQIVLSNTDEVEFIDPGQNFESISCNICGKIIEPEDWQNAMDKSYGHKFTNLTFTTPCCNRETSLNDLNYNWPAGFAKFVICISDANRELTKSELRDLEQIMGTTLKTIWSNY